VLLARRSHGLFEPWRKHGAFLYLLLDVRLSTRRRFYLGGSDSQARGFLVGGTAGRTTLAGEGLQHQDGHSQLVATTVPNCVAYDPAYAYELAVIVQDGLRRMYQEQESVFYYITVMNENYAHPAMPAGVTQGILSGMYLAANRRPRQSPGERCLDQARFCAKCRRPRNCWRKSYGVPADVFSVTSFSELRRNALAVRALEHAASERAAQARPTSSRFWRSGKAPSLPPRIT